MTTKRRAKNFQREKNNQPITVSGKTANQKDYIRSMIENDVVFCTGPSGTGKSFIAAGIAAEKLHKGEVETIIVTRPLVSSGADFGALPGDVKEKVAPYLMPMELNLRHFLKSYYGQYMNDGRIRYEPLELMRGATFHNSFMLLDEAQNCTSDQIKMFITRMGQESKVVINGDTNQTDLAGHSGLSFCVNKLKNVQGVGFANLTYQDILRNGILGRILSALEGVPPNEVIVNETVDDYDDDDDFDTYSLYS